MYFPPIACAINIASHTATAYNLVFVYATAAMFGNSLMLSECNLVLCVSSFKEVSVGISSVASIWER